MREIGKSKEERERERDSDSLTVRQAYMCVHVPCAPSASTACDTGPSGVCKGCHPRLNQISQRNPAAGKSERKKIRTKNVKGE